MFCFVLFFYLSKLLVNQGFVLATLSPIDMVVPSGKGFVSCQGHAWHTDTH